MYIDIDSRGRFSIMDLNERELNLLRESLCAYVQANMGHISGYDSGRIRDFDQQMKRISHGKEKMDPGRSSLCPEKFR